LQALDRRVMLLGRAIYFGVLSALVTSALLIAPFASALVGVGHGASSRQCSRLHWTPHDVPR
jgi:hypothetical protein